MKRILTVLTATFFLAQAPAEVQAAPMPHTAQVELAQELDNLSLVEKKLERRWPRWLRRLLNRRGNGQRPGGRRRGGR
jgi:hypothetical protein